MRSGTEAMFVFPHEVGAHKGALLIARLTDDAGLHWQLDSDSHWQQLPQRDW
jgi:hypothetical protein